MNTLTVQEQHVLEIIQAAFPLTIRPYHAIGHAFGLTEDDVIAILLSLKARNLLRQISAIFNGSYLGFDTALISFHVRDQALEETASVINAHPGVSHNYQREHRFNLWFTLSVPQELDIASHVAALSRLTSCLQYLCLPSRKTFKRQVQFRMSPGLSTSFSSFQVSEAFPKMSRKIERSEQIQRGIMQELQQDLPLTPTPFTDIARRFDIEPSELFDFIAYLKASKKISRFAGIVRHRNLGFTANAMVVWHVPAHLVDAFGRAASDLDAVSHCYERVTFSEWPYNMYTMIHGTSNDATRRVIDELAAKFSLSRYEVLYSSREFKKQRVNFFDDAVYEWHQQYVGTRQML